MYIIQEIAESLQQVKHKGGSRPPIRTLGMDTVSGDCGIFATCNPFQGLVNVTVLIWFAICFHIAKIPQSPVYNYTNGQLMCAIMNYMHI